MTALRFSTRNRLIVWNDRAVLEYSLQPEWTLQAVLKNRDATMAASPPAPADRDAATDDEHNGVLPGRVLSLAFSRHGDILAAGSGEPSRSGVISLWGLSNHQLLRAWIDAHSDTVDDVEFSRDDAWLASASADKFVKIHSIADGSLYRSLEGHTQHVLGLSWKADGTTLATAGADHAIKIWNVETGDQLRAINSYAKAVTAVHFLGISNDIVSCSGDGNVKLHHAADGAVIRSMTGVTDYWNACQGLPALNLISAAGDDGTLNLWDLTTGQTVHTFRADNE